MTKTEQTIRGLLALGWNELPVTQVKTGKARGFSLPGVVGIVWVGKAGSVRTGRTYTDSYPCNDRFKGEILAAGCIVNKG